MVKKNKIQKLALTKEARAEQRARSKKLTASLNIADGESISGQVFNCILQEIRLGKSDQEIIDQLEGSRLLVEARQIELLRKKKRDQQREHSRRLSEANRVFKQLDITQKQYRGKEIWAMVKEFVEHDFTCDQILERMRTHPMVEESHRHTREIREEYERRAAEKHAERLRTRVDMRDVLKYLAEKNGTIYTPPSSEKKKQPEKESSKGAVIRHIGTDIARALGGNPSTSTENPRTYDLPNPPVNAKGMNTHNLADARALVGVHYADFLKYHLHHKDNGLDALEQALIYMKQFFATSVPPNPLNGPVILSDDREFTAERKTANAASEPLKHRWTEEEESETCEKVQASARAAREQKEPRHIIDPVIVNGVEYRSTWYAMQTLAIGEDADARRFRREVKAKGEEIWTYDGEQYCFELRNKRPEQVEAIRKEKQELIDVELKASGRVTEVFLRDPRAQAVFRKLVLENFDGRCAVTEKRLNGVLEAAHIEGAAVDGCYNASNGVLLAPTFHKLYDRHMMGINPETMTVHFAPGIEWEEYEGKMITPLLYRLDKGRLAARWEQFCKENKLA